MPVHQAFRFELDPSDQTRSALASHCGASRFVFNWGLELVEHHLETARVLTTLALRQGASANEATSWARQLLGPVPWSLPALRREWNKAKEEVAPWWAENSKEAYSAGLDALARALTNFFDAKGGRRQGTVGFPKRKKHHARRSCRFSTGAIRVVDGHHVQLPRLGVIRAKERTGALIHELASGQARILSATICEEAGRWFVSFTCQVERQDPPARQPARVVGVDLGVKHLAVLSDGQVVENSKALSRSQRRMARLGRELGRRQEGSKRRARTKGRLARCHQKAANTRRDALHKLTTSIASTYGTVVIEDLAVKNLTASPKALGDPERPGSYLRNGKAAKAGLNRSLLDASPAEFRRQLTYKLEWRGGRLIVADRFFPSSKTCSSCGAVKAKLPLGERTFHCEVCGLSIDRDLNAARNLAAYGRRMVAGSGPETKNARGGDNTRPRPGPAKHADGAGQPGRTVTAPSQEVAA